MKTTFRNGGSEWRRTAAAAACIWARISSTVSERRRPIVPVAQKVQPCLQPTCDDTQSVENPACGMITVSTSSPCSRPSSSFRVPQAETSEVMSVWLGGENCASSARRVLRPSPELSSKGLAPSLSTSQTILARPEPPRRSAAAVGPTPNSAGLTTTIFRTTKPVARLGWGTRRARATRMWARGWWIQRDTTCNCACMSCCMCMGDTEGIR